MLILVLLFVVGVAFGLLLRRRASLAPLVESVTRVVVCALMIVLGASVGANPQVMQNLAGLGLQAVALTVGAVIGSILVVQGLHRITSKDSQP